MTVTRDHLYDQVWARPMLAVAKDYEVSANYLARVCAALNVPWPPRGYWAKVAAGQKPPRSPGREDDASHRAESRSRRSGVLRSLASGGDLNCQLLCARFLVASRWLRGDVIAVSIRD